MPIKHFRYFFVWVLLLLGGRLIAPAQIRDGDIKFKLAQSYDRSGDYESAVKIYEELLSKDSSNIVIFDALRRDYLQLKRYDQTIVLLEQMLSRMPNNVGLLSQLGTTYLLKSEEPKALQVWDRVIASDPNHEGTYRLVANAMMQSRLFEKAIGIFQRGRTALGNPNLFIPDIAYLYSVMLNYAEATREYLKLIRQNPEQLGFAQSRMSMYTGRPEGLSAARQVVEESVKKESENLPFHQLQAWLYMEGKQFDLAYNVYKFIDEKTQASGHELFNFGERALREKAYSAAAKAFQDILTTYPKFDRAAEAKFGYARTLEEADSQSDTLYLFGAESPFVKQPESESKPLFTGAIAAYNRVVGEYPNSEIAARALLRVAVIKQEKFFDLDGAQTALMTLEKSYARYPATITEATLRLGNVYVAMGDLAAAEKQYQTLTTGGPLVTIQREKAMLRLAELDYFQRKFADALAKLKALTANSVSDATNDAITLQVFILENQQSDQQALAQFAQADLLRHQHKLSEALPILQSIVESKPKSDIIDETLLSIGDVYTHMNRYTEAVAAYDELIKKFPESISIDRTLMKMGQVYELGLRDNMKAIGTYQKLLEQFPNSIYVTEARKRVRGLRGDNI